MTDQKRGEHELKTPIYPDATKVPEGHQGPVKCRHSHELCLMHPCVHLNICYRDQYYEGQSKTALDARVDAGDKAIGKITNIGDLKRGERQLKKPICPDCGATLYPQNYAGLRMAYCPSCSPKLNMANMKGYAGDFDWSQQRPREERQEITVPDTMAWMDAAGPEGNADEPFATRLYHAGLKRSQEHQRLQDAIVDAAMAHHAITVPDFDAMGECRRRLWEACEALRVVEG